MCFEHVMIKQLWNASLNDKLITNLGNFCEKYSHIIEKRYLIYTKDLSKDRETLLLPVYLTQFI